MTPTIADSAVRITILLPILAICVALDHAKEQHR